MPSSLRMHTEQTCVHVAVGEEMDREHYDWINMCPPPFVHITYFQKDSHLIYLQIFSGERQAKLAQTQRQLRLRDVGCSTVTACKCHLDRKLK